MLIFQVCTTKDSIRWALKQLIKTELFHPYKMAMKWPCKWVTEVTTAERKVCDTEGYRAWIPPLIPKEIRPQKYVREYEWLPPLLPTKLFLFLLGVPFQQACLF